MLITELPFNLPGKIYRSQMPFGLYDPNGAVYAAYQAANVTLVVVLATIEEILRKTGQDLLAFYAQEGMQVLHLPIPDFGTPDMPELRKTVSQAISAAQSGTNLAIHCSAGIGRTGLFVACIAIQLLDLSGEEAIRWTRKYIPAAVETPNQMRLVYDFREEE